MTFAVLQHNFAFVHLETHSLINFVTKKPQMYHTFQTDYPFGLQNIYSNLPDQKIILLKASFFILLQAQHDVEQAPAM